ncbi:MAG: DNA polymerase III subunit delta [Clostridia bacterium]
MKFIELKKSLQVNIEQVYLIKGEDRFLCYLALEMVSSRVGCNIPEMNTALLSQDKMLMHDIIENCLIFPFGDDKRLVIVKDYTTKSGAEIQELNKYTSNPASTTVLVFFNPESTETFKNVKNITIIDCDKLDINLLNSWTESKLLKPFNVSMNSDAKELLFAYCSSDLTRISSELSKLVSYVGDNGNITTQNIKDMVVEDKDYKIFELTDAIAKGNKEKALDILYELNDKEKSSYSILTPLYNHYRRLLYISINNKESLSRLADYFHIKEFAVKMMFGQAKNYTQRKLKTIVDLLAKADEDIKSGLMKDETAIFFVVLNILMIR